MKMIRDTRGFLVETENPITRNDNAWNISSGVVVIRCNEARITRPFCYNILANRHTESYRKQEDRELPR